MTKGQILVVDDIQANATLLATILKAQDYEVYTVNSGQAALAEMDKTPFDLIMLDIYMPDMSGYRVCEAIKSNRQTCDVPVIFVSSSDEVLDKVKAFQVGGVDYVTKPFQADEVIARVATHVTLYQQRQELTILRSRERSYYEDLSQMKDQFVRTVSHDLKNPIALILGSLDLLEGTDTSLADPEVQEILGIMRRKAEFMLEMVTNLLDLARIEAGIALHLAPVSLSTLLQECYAGFYVLAERKQIALSMVPPAEDCNVMIDLQQFSRVMNNLLTNAIKYTPEGGLVQIGAQVESDRAIIRVADTGLGIPEEDMPHLFDRFFRVRQATHMQEEGTGLGLSITKAIVEQHQGQILVESRLGQGSTFSIVLPLIG